MGPHNNQGDEQSNQQLPEANPKVVVGVLVVIGLAALILGFFHILNTIRSPFSLNRGLTNTVSSFTEEDERLRNQDSDGDSISDFDELTLYSTSPFIPDTDSDGQDDYAEIAAGTDPNCPEGSTCGIAVANSNTNASGGQTSQVLSQDITTAQLRETLKEAGIPAYIIDNTDDASLLALYEEALQNAGSSGTSEAPVTDSELANTLKTLGPAEVRTFLIDGGLEASALEGITDEQLLDVFRRAVDQKFASN